MNKYVWVKTFWWHETVIQGIVAVVETPTPTHETFAEKAVVHYIQNQDSVKKELTEKIKFLFKGCSEEEIISSLGNPTIRIENEDKGILYWFDQKIDNRTVSIEFDKDMKLGFADVKI